MKKTLSFLAISFVIFATAFKAIDIPTPWEASRLHSLHLPLPDSTIDIKSAPAEFYNTIPKLVLYKTYPFYLPGTEPKGYYDSLRKLSPQMAVDTTSTNQDWVKMGELVYSLPQTYQVIDPAFESILPDLGAYWKKMGAPMKKNHEIPFMNIVVRKKGVLELGSFSCGSCHSKLMPDGRLLKGAQGNFPFDKYVLSFPRIITAKHPTDSSELMKAQGLLSQVLFATPWIKDESQARLGKLTIQQFLRAFETSTPGVVNRHSAALGYPIAIPDLYNLKERKYLDHTGQMKNRDINDVMLYATLNQAADTFDEYGKDNFTVTPRGIDLKEIGFTRYSDEQLYALAQFLYTLKSPANPVKAPKALLSKGEKVFKMQGCVTCHTPPLYTNNKLTPVDGFTPSKGVDANDIFDVSVGTDPTLALATRRSTGFYKVPSLIGVWNRTALMHGGSITTLEEMLDPRRLEPDYKPTGYTPPWSKTMSVPGHPFGLEANAADKEALVAFLKSL